MTSTGPARSSSPGCLFCRIVAGEIPADVVARTRHSVAFRDIAPQAPVHVLVVPNVHLIDATDIGPHDAAVLTDLFLTANAVADELGIAEGGYRIVANVGEDAGNTVSHLHLHVLGGRSLTWPPG